MSTVKVSFTYEPDDPDPDHRMGISEEEFIRLNDFVAEIGGEDIQVEKVSD